MFDKPIACAFAALLLVAGRTPGFADETKCVASQGFVVVAREHRGTVGSDIVLRKARDEKAKGACSIAVRKGDYVVVPKTNSSAFLAFRSGLLALDEGTGAQRSLTVIDAATRKRIVTSQPYADAPPLEFEAGATALTFWRIGPQVPGSQCPAAWRARDDNRNAAKAHVADEMIVRYGADPVPKTTGRSDCAITEDDL